MKIISGVFIYLNQLFFNLLTIYFFKLYAAILQLSIISEREIGIVRETSRLIEEYKYGIKI